MFRADFPQFGSVALLMKDELSADPQVSSVSEMGTRAIPSMRVAAKLRLSPKTLPFTRFMVMLRETGLRAASGVEAEALTFG